MIKGKVYLKDINYDIILEKAHNRNNKHFMVNNEHYYSDNHIKQAIDANIKKNLNYNCTTGIIRYNNEWMGCYSNRKDLPEYENEIEVLIWEFLNFIMNSAGRLKRGYEA